MSPMVWQVRRELWENRSIYLAPLIVAAVIALASFGAVRHNLKPDNLPTHEELVGGVLIGTAVLVAIFFCLGALYGEGGDRRGLLLETMPGSGWTGRLSE